MLAHYIAEVWLDGDADGLDADVPILELNILDSVAVFDLVHYLQGELHITVPIQEITPANFRTIATIAALVDRLRTGGPAGRGGA